MASSGTTHLHTLVLHTKSDLSHAHLASVSVSLRFTAPQIQHIPSLSSNALFICCSYTHSPSLGTKSCRVYNYRKVSLVYRCLTILKPDSFSDFPQAVYSYSSAHINNRTVHSPTTNKTHVRTHRSKELRPLLGLLSCLFQSQRISDKGWTSNFKKNKLY